MEKDIKETLKIYKQMNKINYYINGDTHMAVTPLSTINYDTFVDTFLKLDNTRLDDYTANGLYTFVNEGFNCKRVSNAPKIDSPNVMILFAYDNEFVSKIGLAICFDKKFYSLDFRDSVRSEIELYNIFAGKKFDFSSLL